MSFGIVFFAYSFVFFKIPKTVFWSPDGGGKYIQMHCTEWDEGFKYRLVYPGARLDPEYRFYPRRMKPGHRYYEASDQLPQPLPNHQMEFGWPVWFPLVSKYMEKAFGLPGIYFLPLICGFLVVGLSAFIAYRLQRNSAQAAAIAMGLATPLFFYSLCFWEHVPVVLLGLLGFSILFFRRNSLTLVTVLLCFILLVSAAVLRVEMFFFLFSIIISYIVCSLFEKRRCLSPKTWAGLIALLVMTIAMTGLNFSFSLDDTLIPTKAGRFIQTCIELVKDLSNWQTLPEAVLNLWINSPLFMGPYISGLLRWLGLICIILCLFSVFCRKETRVYIVIACSFIMMGIFFKTFYFQQYICIHSIFPISPWLVFFPLFYSERVRTEFRERFLWVTSLIYLFVGTLTIFINSFSHNCGITGGLEWGPRYILSIYPLLGCCSVVGVVRTAEETGFRMRKLLIGMACVSVLAGIAFEVRGIKNMISDKTRFGRLQQIFLNERVPVVTDVYLLAGKLGVYFKTWELYTLDSEKSLTSFLELARGKIRKFIYCGDTPFTRETEEKLAGKIRIDRFNMESGFAIYRCWLLE